MKSLLSVGIIVTAMTLASCGGGSGTVAGGTGGGGTGGGGTGGGGTGGGGTGGGGTTFVDIGSGTPPGFLVGLIDVAVPNLAAGGATSLTVTFVDSNNLLHTSDVDVSFSSPCIGASTANITGPTSTNTGILTVTYSAAGCSGADVINATANVSGVNIATGVVTVAPATVGSIEFVSATPEQIALTGTGGVETSVVAFRVVDSTGGPVPGVDVDFSLNTTVGGISFTPTSATSGTDGGVQTVVESGTVATTLRMTATITTPGPAFGISTQSSALVVTTGLPDQDSMSLATECANMETWSHDGVQNQVTVRLADRYGNPVPDGTAVAFNTEGGKVGGGCTTFTTGGSPPESGLCTVNWTSQDPRPANGRVTLVATAIGEETFLDSNGNGIFDDGVPTDTHTDLDEAFRDDNENGVYDPGVDGFFFDFDNSGTFTTGDGLFNGLLCAHSSLCSPTQTTGISDSVVIVMSGSGAVISDDQGGTQTGSGTVVFTVGDLNDQPMPAGTTIKATNTNGEVVAPQGGYTVPCTSFDGPGQYPFIIQGNITPPASGALVLEVETPLGLKTVYFMNMND